MSLIALPLSGSAVEFWVSPDGNDGNPGTSARPLASMARAVERVRAFRLEKPNDIQPTEVILRSGVYRLQAPFCLRPEDSETLIVAAPGEKPVLSGGVQITGWQPAGHVAGLPKPAWDAVWVAKIPKLNGHFVPFRQLWVNGSKAVRAREPNDGSLER